MYDADSMVTEIIRQQAQTARELQLVSEARRLSHGENPKTTPAGLHGGRFALPRRLRRPLVRILHTS
jgi:hypothetical protein